jgi:hypothetical protein
MDANLATVLIFTGYAILMIVVVITDDKSQNPKT